MGGIVTDIVVSYANLMYRNHIYRSMEPFLLVRMKQYTVSTANIVTATTTSNAPITPPTVAPMVAELSGSLSDDRMN